MVVTTSAAPLPTVVVEFSKGDTIAAIYDHKWYIGIIEEVLGDASEGVMMNQTSYRVNFMQSAKRHFKWPKPADKCSVESTQIVCSVEPLEPLGKSARLFKLNEIFREMIETKFAEIESKQ